MEAREQSGIIGLARSLLLYCIPCLCFVSDLKKSTVLTASHSLTSSPFGSFTACNIEPDPNVASVCWANFDNSSRFPPFWGFWVLLRLLNNGNKEHHRRKTRQAKAKAIRMCHRNGTGEWREADHVKNNRGDPGSINFVDPIHFVECGESAYKIFIDQFNSIRFSQEWKGGIRGED